MLRVRYAVGMTLCLSQSFIRDDESPRFFGFSLRGVILQYLERRKAEWRNKIIKEFRNWVSDSRLGVTECNPTMILSCSPLHLELVNRNLNYVRQHIYIIKPQRRREHRERIKRDILEIN